MKTMYFRFVLVLFFLPALAVADNNSTGKEFNGRHTEEKKVRKTFEVSSDALLEIDNSYGNVDVTTWNENRIVIEVTLKTNGNNKEKVIERLQELDVDFTSSRSKVSARTILEKKDSSWWSKLFEVTENVNIEISYLVRAPATNNIDIENDYGNISVDRLEGNAKLSCDYGRLLIGELMGNNNLLSFDYTRNSQIGFIKKGRISADYSEFTIEEAGTLEISADYTDTNIVKVENLNFDGDYGNLKLEKVRNLKGSGDYLGTKIGAVYGTLELDLDYGSASIERIMKSAQNIEISSDYTGIRIGYFSGVPFRFQVQTSYGNIKGLDDNQVNMEKQHRDNSDNLYEGYFLENSGSKIMIDASYGNITFTKN